MIRLLLLSRKPPPSYKTTSLPLYKLIVPPSKLIVTIFAPKGGFLTRGVIAPPSELIVNIFVPPKGGFLTRGVFFLRVRDHSC